MILKTKFPGILHLPNRHVHMYDLLHKKYQTVNKITNACLKRIITQLFHKYLANWALTINVHNSFITQLV